MADVENMEFTEVGEVTQEEFDTLTAASQLGHPIGTDLFGGFDEADEDEDEQTEAERQALLQIKTLVRVFDDSQPLKVAYIRHGVAKKWNPS